MNSDAIYIEGELYLTIETVAELYSVQPVWLREACELGLLGPSSPHGSTLCIAAFQLDRVASLVRLHAVLGLDLRHIADELGDAG